MKISQKLTTGFLGIALLMGTVGSISIYLQNESSKRLAIKEATNLAKTIAYFTATERDSKLEAGKTSIIAGTKLQTQIKLLHDLQNRDIVIVDRSETIVGDVIPQNVGKNFDHDLGDEVKKTVQDGISRTFIETSVDYPAGIKQIVVPLKNENGEIIGGVILEYTHLYDEVLKASKKSMTTTIVMTLVTSFLAIYLGYFISKSISRRIGELNQALVKITEGDLDSQVEMKSKDEIGDLAISFNKMAEHLKKFKTELVKANHELLGEIVERKQAEAELHQVLKDLQQTQAQLIQTKKMSSLGQLVAGVAHEINNPVTFIYGNLTHSKQYIQDLLELVSLYQEQFPQPGDKISAQVETIDLEFLMEDLPKMLASMMIGADRIRKIVLSLRNFSRLDEADLKPVDIHEGIDSTLLILQSRLKAKSGEADIKIIKEYGNLPLVECYAGQLNQVFMNIINNAIDALDEFNQQRTLEEIKANPSIIKISTKVVDKDWVAITITDNGQGMTEEVSSKLFDPFFTTKPVGKGTGLGLSISYQIVTEKHCGKIRCDSALGKKTEFVVEIPIQQHISHKSKKTDMLIN